MKELSIEQKAKRYDEALEKARQLCAYPTTKPFISDLKDLFPELKEDEESRNEMIKGAAIEFVRQNKSFNSCLGIRKEQVIDWLEKQGKQTYVKWSYDEGKQIQINPSEYINDMGGNGCYLKNTAQASAWSEEDEEIVEALNVYVKNLDILFSEIRIGDVDILSKEFREKVQHWLKSLRPQKQWKPSESDIRVLEQVIDGTANPINYHATLHAVLEKLKKLREE